MLLCRAEALICLAVCLSLVHAPSAGLLSHAPFLGKQPVLHRQANLPGDRLFTHLGAATTLSSVRSSCNAATPQHATRIRCQGGG